MPRTDKVVDGYYKTAYWKRRRLAQLRAQPLCVFLAETPPRTTPATTVDHKVPFVNWNSFVLGETLVSRLRSVSSFDLRILRGDLLAKENNLPFQAIDIFSRKVWTCRDKSRLVGTRRLWCRSGFRRLKENWLRTDRLRARSRHVVASAIS
jgi:hypothetical protein